MVCDRKWQILFGTALSVLLIGVDFGIVNTSLAAIGNEFGASTSQLQWMMAGYGIFFTAMLIALGRVGDIKGRRKALYVGIIGFGLASLGAGLAASPIFLIIMRMLQGLFSAVLYPAAVAITVCAFPKEQQGRAMGIFGSFFGVGFALGPVLGSFITTLLSWRWIFFVNIPVVVTSLLICLPVICESKHPEVKRVDWPGAFSLIIFLLAITFLFNEGPIYGWSSAVVIIALGASLVFPIIFYYIEKNADYPLIPIKALKNKGFLLGVLIYFSTISLAWSVMFLMPLYLHHQLGFSIGITGALLLAMTLMTMLMPSVGGLLLDKGNKLWVSHVPMLLSITSMIIYAFLNASGPIWLVIIGFILFGAAWGLSNGMSVPLALSDLKDSHDHGLIAGVAATLANAFGIPLFTLGILFFRYGQNTSFIQGMHYTCYLLLLVSVVMWIIMLFVTISKKKVNH